MTIKDLLICTLEGMLDITIPENIDENVLRGFWRNDNFDELYKLEPFCNFKLIQKARFEGIIDEFFKNKIILNNKQSLSIPIYEEKKEEYPMATTLNINAIKNHNNNNNNNNDNDNDNINPPNIPDNFGQDCCEDVCEHAICCNCYGFVTSSYGTTIDTHPINYNEDEFGDGIRSPFCGQLSTAICCKCGSDVVDINGHEINTLNRPLVEHEVMRQRRQRKYCFIMFLIFLLAFIAGGLYYLYNFKPIKLSNI